MDYNLIFLISDIFEKQQQKLLYYYIQHNKINSSDSYYIRFGKMNDTDSRA